MARAFVHVVVQYLCSVEPLSVETVLYRFTRVTIQKRAKKMVSPVGSIVNSTRAEETGDEQEIHRSE